MSIAWIAPVALAGIGLIALPIAVHLLVRQPARRMPFPSLRFLRETPLAALRRRTVQDAWLLLCRSAIVALAAVALAGPVLQTASRATTFAGRTSRAIVVIDAAGETALMNIREGAFATAAITREHAADAIADAMRWLNAQPASAREIVITGSLRRGAVTEAALATVPAGVGIRFVPVTVNASPRAPFSVLARRDGHLRRIDRDVTFDADATRVAERGTAPVPDDLVAISAKAEDRDLADAALRAALDAGVPWTDFTTPVVVVWEGGAAPLRPNARTIDMPVPRPASVAADRVHDALSGAVPHPVLTEPIAIAPEQLAAWTRPPGPVSADAPVQDEGDRRWLWAAVLMLLLFESWLRRSARASGTQHTSEEARVA